MAAVRLLPTFLAFSALVFAQGTGRAVEDAANRFTELSSRVPSDLRIDFQLSGAHALARKYPTLSHQMLKPVLDEIKAGKVQKGMTFENPGATPRRMAPEISALYKRSADLRRNLTDADRSWLAIEQAKRIDALPAGQDKLNLARGLADLSTEGDLGKPALTAVAGALAHALHENPGSLTDYVELASLIRYEGVPPLPYEEPAEKAAEGLLALRDQVRQSASFTLTGLDGKTWSLSALRGKIVLLNFWATWCQPCRKEMPDMEKLSRTYAGKGLVVLAVSDEDRDTVAPFIAKQGYTFAVLLDNGGKVHGEFDVAGIPRSFIFDRDGGLAAQAIDMRTMGQFLDLLKKAGLEPVSSQ